jgi:LysR family pca operon transcriptional activator
MIDRRIKFRHIQCFVEISREGSFKAAAQKLHLTQPAISKTQKELEQILGHALLERDRSGVSLTPDGETFLRFAQMSIANLQQGIDGMAGGTLEASQALTVGVLPSVAARLIPPVAEQFGIDAPGVVLRIVDGPFDYMVDRLKLGELDLIVGRMGSHEHMNGLAFISLYRERVCFIVRPGHPLMEQPILAEIVNYPIIYPTRSAAVRRDVDRFLLEQGIGHVPRTIESVSGAFSRVYLRDSDAIWIISEGVVAQELARGDLARLPVNTDTTLGPIGIMSREDWDFTPQARLFQRIARHVIDTSPDVMP